MNHSDALFQAYVNVRELLAKASDVELEIVQSRLVYPVKQRLRQIGHRHALTRERIRQIESDLKERILHSIDAPELLSLSLTQALDEITHIENVVERLEEMAGVADRQISRPLAYALLSISEYQLLDGSLVSKDAFRAIGALRSKALAYADDCGLIYPPRLKSQLPINLQNYWPWFIEQCNLHATFDFLSLRNSNRARVKAALLSRNEPITRPEIATMCNMSNKVVSATLSSIKSIKRVDRARWALRSWTMHEYKGIVTGMVEMINQAGGSIKLDELTNRMAMTYDVTRESVESYAHTPKFSVSDRQVRIAESRPPVLRSLDSVVSGYNTKRLPYWVFAVRARHLRGFSIVGVPDEVANFLGCPVDGSTVLKIQNLPDCRDLTIQWKLWSTTKASIGHIREALTALGLYDNDYCRLTLLAPGLVELTREEKTEVKPLAKTIWASSSDSPAS
ncbi:MAG: hypothetical protein F4W90_11855 [Gammaproteobacteria bacterium]|nr:hypothetical protein [Gammaproteobacteria bacterium]